MTEVGARGRSWGSKLLLAGLVLCVLFSVGYLGHAELTRKLRADYAREGQGSLTLYSEMTSGWLDRFRALTPIYARHPAVVEALRNPSNPDLIDGLNRDLEIWNAASGTADTYVMKIDGRTIAASNWAEKTSFVGKNFSFRPYFAEARDGRLGRFFGLGTTSGVRGYYFASPVRDGGTIIGVVVTKVAVEGLEQDFRQSRGQIFVTDAAGVIILAGNPLLVLKTLTPMSAADRRRISAAQQFDLSAIAPAPIAVREAPEGEDYEIVVAPADRAQAPETEFLHLSRTMPVEQWNLHLLMDTAPLRAELWTYTMLAAALAISAGMGVAMMVQRRRRLLERLRDRERAQAVLERRVEERTSELSHANVKLQEEVAERKAAEESLRRTQTELIQAGKLAALGQMSAALSHEFNQPLMAIRAYAENAIAFVDAGAGPQASENLSRVLRLTDRMGQLSKHLTRFARRSQDTVEPVSLDAALEETLSLLEGRIERAGASVVVPTETGIKVLGGQVRLQHVFMNLIGNALDATPPDRDPVISIRATCRGADVGVVVEDNGTGIAEDALPRIFDPFFTTKEVGKGIGLGLSISYNIIKDFGGTIRAENREEGGARFTLRLRAAEAGGQEAAE
ncbi:ATP-binding protein [Ostreiculturibacter nitratireducens]|uniref:ATP-binding protein n=1 Tax=Ostreiculturibacter nitratireducens TaxID=3075226 RepID=UPI0031B5BDEE